MSTLVFVYGTLKRGARNHRFMAGQEFVGEARTAPGYRLFDLSGFPGMVPWPDDRDGVTGEVWRVEGPALARLDAFEGLAEGLYRREPVPLLAPFAEAKVDAYLYARDISGHAEIGNTWQD